MRILTVISSPRDPSVSALAGHVVQREIAGLGAESLLLDLRDNPLPLFTEQERKTSVTFPPIRDLVLSADAYVLTTPDYHGSLSGSLKNFLDYFWKEFGGKMFGTIVASHEKGLTVADQIRTIVRQCYGWSLPYAVTVSESDVTNPGSEVSLSASKRLKMLARDMVVYGGILHEQRQRDLNDHEQHTFMAHYRIKK